MKYDLFLSHSHKDSVFVDRLAKDCVERGISVWLDEWELIAGSILPRGIQEGIENSRLFGIVLSPDSVESNWVPEELYQAIMAALSRNPESIIPILLRKDVTIPEFWMKKGDILH